MNYTKKEIQSRLAQAFGDNGEALSFLIEEVEQSIFSRMKISVDKDSVVELYFVLKGLKEVESAIQNCINENVKELEDNENGRR